MLKTIQKNIYFYLTACLLIGYANLANAVLAPDFALNNTPIAKQLSDLKGRVVYLDFWASWCGPCRKSFPWMNNLQTKYKKDGLVVLAINLDKEVHLAQAFLRDNPALFEISYDPEGNVALAYQLKGMPSSYIINQTGEIAYSHAGFTPKKAQQYEQEITTLLFQ
ncbi:TlpA disulfide reductase family protein [Algibacillus agarilyticus]|uniref:TlpA disulfide reductase family protein n=1 Tax=Algibacillus agarilyticus TaxID=2234133 RepID=UPI001E63A7A3|nr:TlpA disulfide reductase family protein [Algibacillus agarilyticus]